ncbi:MAG: hypothetical protein HC937_00630 [Aquincola sp.]|nr:hypothetical protein [Aquincola sp.]
MFSECVDKLRNAPEEQRADVVLCIDDDIEFGAVDAQTIVDMARQRQAAVSAVYVNTTHAICAAPLEGVPGRYLVGLGFCAVPVPLLLNLAARLTPVQGPTGMVLPWCTSGPNYSTEPPRWECDDYSFSRLIGGAVLAPIAVGHVKRVGLWPDEQTIAQVQTGVVDTTPEAKRETMPAPPSGAPQTLNESAYYNALVNSGRA